MTTPANLTLTAIATRVMNQLRMPVSNTAELGKVTAIINEVYRDIAAKSDWWWLVKRAVVNTVVKVESRATVTNGATGVTLSSSVTQDVAGYVFLTDGADDSGAVYRVASHGGASAAITLDAAYTNPTSTSAAYQLYRDSYNLPDDCGKVLNVKRFGYTQPLERAGIEFISHMKLFDTAEGKPLAYSVFDFATVGDPTSRRLLQVHPYPDKAYRLEVFYKQNLNTELAGTTRPFIPDDFSQVLIYGTLARAYPIFLNDETRGKYFQALFNDVLALMAAQQKEYAKDQSGVGVKDDYRQHHRFRYPGRVSLGSFFDRWPNNP